MIKWSRKKNPVSVGGEYAVEDTGPVEVAHADEGKPAWIKGTASMWVIGGATLGPSSALGLCSA